MKLTASPVFVSLTCAFVFLLCLPVESYSQSNHSAVRTIVLDPGHGGKDPGAVHGSSKEKDIVLSVALKLGALIEKNLPDVKVVYTRKTDVFIELAERGNIANKAGADLFVSIHVNSFKTGSPRGTETYVMGHDVGGKNMDVAMRENDVITFEDDFAAKYEGYVPGSAESFIIFSLMQYAHLEQSMYFANTIQQNYNKSTSLPDRGAKQANFLVLWRTAMPSVLTELGFVSNEEDRKMMTTDAGQEKLAAALFNSISEYKSRVENKSVAVRVDGSGKKGSSTLSGASAAPVTGGSVVYMIQVCSSTQKLGQNGSVLKPHKDKGVTEKIVDGLFKYYVGSCGTYAEATELQKEVRKTTPDAFMVAFRDGVQIAVGDARIITGK